MTMTAFPFNSMTGLGPQGPQGASGGGGGSGPMSLGVSIVAVQPETGMSGVFGVESCRPFYVSPDGTSWLNLGGAFGPLWYPAGGGNFQPSISLVVDEGQSDILLNPIFYSFTAYFSLIGSSDFICITNLTSDSPFTSIGGHTMAWAASPRGSSGSTFTYTSPGSTSAMPVTANGDQMFAITWELAAHYTSP